MAKYGASVFDEKEYGHAHKRTFGDRRGSLARKICQTQGVAYDPPVNHSIVGIALSTLSLDPLNGMRCHPENHASGWFIWGGTELSEDAQFFQPTHVECLPGLALTLIPYLALPPGWRFLLGANNFVDVWFDENLLRS